MLLLKTKLLFLLFAFPLLISAGEQPSFLITEKGIIEEFRGQLRLKLEELSNNYIVSKTDTNITWTSNDGVKCNGTWKPARSILASVSLSQTNEMILVDIRGCQSKLLFREVFSFDRDGDFSLDDYLAGKISTESLTRYLLVDNQKKNIFDLRMQSSVSSLSFLEKEFLEIYKEEERWQYKAIGYEARYNNGGFGFNVTMMFPDQRITLDWQNSDIRIFDGRHQRIAVNAFLTSYSSAIQNTTLVFTSSILKNLMSDLPSTEFVSTGGANSRFLDEMRLVYTRLLNNLELNLVKQFVQEVIKFIEDGVLKITDNRQD